MTFDNIKYVYFLGIGGIGMSALARYFNAMGKSVSGYDKTRTLLTDELVAEGIEVHFEDNVELIKSEVRSQKSEVLVVLTPAIPKDHSELKFFQKNDYTVKKRSEVLGMITEQSFTIAVAGTHGKTTTSSLIAHILRSSEVDCTAFLGGITQNYGTNLLLSEKLKKKKSKIKPIVVVEADEYDRSFLTLHPDIAVITSVDADHLDIYGDQKHMEESYRQFAGQVKEGGVLIIKKGVDKILVLGKNGKKLLTYSLHQSSDFYARKIAIKKGQYIFDVVTPEQAIRGMLLGVPGKHNVENAVAAVAVAQQMNVFSGNIKNALTTFKGVKRRFEYHIKTDKLVYIDDYAHHPEELRACISAVKEMYPSKKVTGIFQPHLFTRTRDFADEFARSLELLDELILLDIYPAREKSIEGVTSEMLLEKVMTKNKKLVHKKELIREIKNREMEVLVTLGAGDIDTMVEPIKNELMIRVNKN
ncbi:MAG: UDP-N-acetylmuramate--L-alanine ligase [Bacteroidetes bacterium]|nr:UDP-N-acetylmuramate--L-alanine ligase [Bacteroidota bacterium]